MKNFIIQNIYSDVLTDEQFAKTVEALYDTIAIVSLEGGITKLNSIILEVSMIIELRRRLCGNEKNSGITECNIIEKGKIQCNVSETCTIHTNDITKSWLFRRAIELIRNRELCNMNIYEYAEKLWEQHIEALASYLNTVIENIE